MHILISAILGYWQLWLLVLIVLAGVFIFTWFFPQEQKPLGYQYQQKESIMTPAEHRMFITLLEMVGDRFYVFPQIHLDAILNYKVPGQNSFGAFRHINEKSVDFVICDKAQEKPLLAIELDDWSHERGDRIKRDAIVNEIFKDSSFPLLRFSPREAADKEAVKQRLFDALGLL